MKRVLILVAIALGGPVTSAHAALGLTVSADPEGKQTLDPIRLAVPPGGTDAEATVWISQTGETELAGVVFSASLPGKTVTVTPSAATNVPPRGRVLRLTLTVPAPRGGQTGDGKLIAEQDGRAQTVAGIEVQRDEDDVLAIVGAGEKGLTPTAQTEAFTAAFDIVSRANRPIRDVRIQIPPLRDPDGVDIDLQVTVDGAQLGSRGVDFAPNESRRLVLAADLIVSGDHTGRISLIYGGRRTDVALVVTRTRVKPAVEFDADRVMQLSTRQPAEFPMVVRPLEGRKLDLGPPALRVQKEEDGSQLTDVPRATATIDGRADGIKLPPDGGKTVNVKLGNVRGPGKFIATLSWGAGTEKVEAKATIYRRRPLRVALAILLPSLILAMLITHAWTVTMTRKRAQRKVAEVLEDLNRVIGSEPVAADDVRPLQRLMDLLGKAHDRLEKNADEDVSADLQLVVDRTAPAGRWLALRRAARDAGAGVAVADKLRVAERWIADDVGTKEAAITALDEAQTALDRTQSVRDELNALSDAVADWVAESVDPPPELAALEGLLRDAQAKLDRSDVQGADDDRVAAWKLWAAAVVGHLRARFDAGVPRWVDQGVWTELRRDLEAKLALVAAAEPREAMRIYREVSAAYLGHVAGALREWLDENPTGHGDREVAGREAALALAALPGDLRTASVHYDMAVDAMSAGQGIVGPALTGGVRDAAVGQPALAGARHAVPLVRPPLIGPSVGYTRRLKWIRLGLAFAAVVFAAAGAILTIWVPDRDWGGAGDMLALVLWGLGLQQIGNVAAFSGVASILDRVAGRPAAQ